MRSFLTWATGSGSASTGDPDGPAETPGSTGRGRNRSSRNSGSGVASRVARAAMPRRRSHAQNDPLRMDPSLFEYVAHRSQHGEVFVAYRLLGHPMVLHSLADGLPLACLHLRVAPGRGIGDGLMCRRPGRGEGDFLGLITADNQEFELIMTNLTTDAVMMFDIGGTARAREEQFWELTDAKFWSGRHRNDRRLNRSNILWPMTANVCSENNFYLQDHAEHRRLVMRAKSAAADPATGLTRTNSSLGESDGYPLHVYPKFGTRIASRFMKTAWTCPQTILVVATPSMLDGNLREGHNIQVERPQQGPVPSANDTASDVVEQIAATLGIRKERLVEVIGIDLAVVEELPRQMQREIVLVAIENADLSALEDEPPLQAPRSGSASTAAASGNRAGANVGAEAASRADGTEALGMGARPAEVAAGRRLLRESAHSLLIEKFDFERRGASATLTLGVREGLQLCDADDAAEQAEADEQLVARLEDLMTTRKAELLEEVSSSNVYDTPECVVCMEASPDTVLYQCGHRCVHYKCVESAQLRRCPLCRQPIVALLPVSGQVD